MNTLKPVRTGTGKTIFRCSLAYLAVTAIFSISSCKKENNSQVNALKASNNKGTYADKPFRYESNAMISVRLAAMDKEGNLIDPDTRLGQKPTGNGCDFLFYNYNAVYRGYSLDNICFNNPNNYLYVTFDLLLPTDITPLPSDAGSFIKVRLASNGFYTSPSGTGFRTLAIQNCYVAETYNTGAPDNLDMKKWRIISTLTAFSEMDYCQNASLQTIFKIATDCPNIPYVTTNPGIITESLSPTKKVVPMMVGTNESTSSQPKFRLTANFPLCSLPPCHGDLQWADTYRVRYRKQGSPDWFPSDWGQPVPGMSTLIPIPSIIGGFGIYEYQTRGKIMDTPQEVWSDWSAISTVNTF